MPRRATKVDATLAERICGDGWAENGAQLLLICSLRQISPDALELNGQTGGCRTRDRQRPLKAPQLSVPPRPKSPAFSRAFLLDWLAQGRLRERGLDGQM